MTILDKVVKVFENHPFDKIILPEQYNNVYQYLKDFPEEEKRFRSEYDDWGLNKEFKEHIPKGWYGFNVGEPIIPVWMEIIREIILICIEADPNFEINQIKMKLGGIRFYCNSDIIEDLYDVEILIMRKLFDNALIY
jgi:hypothetical protein